MTLEITHCHLLHIVLVMQVSPDSMWQWITQGAGTTGPIGGWLPHIRSCRTTMFHRWAECYGSAKGTKEKHREGGKPESCEMKPSRRKGNFKKYAQRTC